MGTSSIMRSQNRSGTYNRAREMNEVPIGRIDSFKALRSSKCVFLAGSAAYLHMAPQFATLFIPSIFFAENPYWTHGNMNTNSQARSVHVDVNTAVKASA